MIDELKAKLTQTLAAEHVEVIDNTWQHAGHSGAAGGSHIKVIVVSPQFEGVPLMDQHRLVHQALKEDMATRIHALEVKTWTPKAWQAR